MRHGRAGSGRGSHRTCPRVSCGLFLPRDLPSPHQSLSEGPARPEPAHYLPHAGLHLVLHPALQALQLPLQESEVLQLRQRVLQETGR